jgi:hypothetical protein
MKPNDRFAILNDWLGYGNRDGDICFITTSEEAARWKIEEIKEDENFEKFRNTLIFLDKGGIERRRF